MAKKKSEKISVNEFEKAANIIYGETVDVEWHGLTIGVKKRLSLRDMVLFVDDVVRNVVEEDGTYYPEYRWFMIYKNIIERYTNLTLPQNIEKQYELLDNTSVISAVLSAVDPEQYNEVVEVIDKKIDYMQQTALNDTQRRADDAYHKIKDIADQMEKMFAGITPEDIAKVVGSVADGKIDEHKIVDAYFEKKAEAGEPDGKA